MARVDVLVVDNLALQSLTATQESDLHARQGGLCEQVTVSDRGVRGQRELGVDATTDVPPPTLAMPGPDVLGPVAERYGIEVVGPPHRTIG